jgi:hypothetical protein
MNLVASHLGAVMSEHKFKIGERLFPACSLGLDLSESWSRDYQSTTANLNTKSKSLSGVDERIVRESQLKPSPWRNQSGRPYSA